KVEVSISPENQSGAPGETLTFTVTVKNTGNVSDNYDLTADDNTNWSLTLPGMLTNVIPGGNRMVNLSVGIPDEAENSTRDNITVTATSRADTTVKDSASCIAHAVGAPPPPLPEHGVQVSISPEDQRGSPGETLTFTVTVKNKGNVEDSYDLTASDYEGWGATLAENLLTIPAGESRTTTMSITVPSDAAEDELTHVTVIATSRGDPTVSDSTTSRAIAERAPEGPGVELPIPLAISAFLIGAAIIVPTYLLRERRKKAARRRVFRDVSFGFR
ncbi:MAG: FixG Ig-like domain-containing protein, partial [Candidatus Hadarchaeaceae archaeon]